MLDCSWEPGTIGEFERLSRLAQSNRGFLQEIADTFGVSRPTIYRHLAEHVERA